MSFYSSYFYFSQEWFRCDCFQPSHPYSCMCGYPINTKEFGFPRSLLSYYYYYYYSNQQTCLHLQDNSFTALTKFIDISCKKKHTVSKALQIQFLFCMLIEQIPWSYKYLYSIPAGFAITGASSTFFSPTKRNMCGHIYRTGLCYAKLSGPLIIYLKCQAAGFITEEKEKMTQRRKLPTSSMYIKLSKKKLLELLLR